jgi:uncharacterized protein
MAILTASLAELAQSLPAFAPVPAPVGDPVSEVRVASRQAEGGGNARAGLWECTPGRWIRQIRQAEFCHFLEGEATFTPDDGSPPVTLRAGDIAFFPANSTGEWDVRTFSRKTYIVLDRDALA